MKEFEIIIIEDNKDLGEMLVLILSVFKKKIKHYLKANEFMNDLPSLDPELIISDMLLSGIDGRTICSNLKKKEETKHIPIIMISAHPDAKISCLEAGADTFISKPFDMYDFRKEVEKFLQLN